MGKHKPHKIPTLARARGLKLEEVAERVGIKTDHLSSHLSRVYFGSVPPTVVTARRIAAALGFSIGEVFRPGG